MTDEQIIAKVRAAAEQLGAMFDGATDNVGVTCARAALALIEQREWHVAEEARHRELRLQHQDDGHPVWSAEEYAKQNVHGVAAAALLAAIEKAVGE